MGTPHVPRGASVSSCSSAGTRFEPTEFDALRGWASDDHLAAWKAFRRSAPRLLEAAGSGSAARPKMAIPEALLALCAEALALPPTLSRLQARSFFEEHFVPHAVRHAAPEGLLTGYYEPVLDGARTPDARFNIPIYRRPPDLVNLVHEAERGALVDQLTHARRTAAGIEPYATRAEIEGGALSGQNLELLYLADPVAAFFLHIQGSGRIRLRDGTSLRVHYDGKNGHPYTSIGRVLIDRGLLRADEISLAALGRWLRADPERGRQIMHQNASFVFFRELLGEEAHGPLGVLSIPLVAGRSLAVDTSTHAIGTPIYVVSPSLRHGSDRPSDHGFARLMIAHDVGSAIRGPERGDIYFGSGPKAGQRAGITKHPGQFFVLLPRQKPARARTSPSAPKPQGRTP